MTGWPTWIDGEVRDGSDVGPVVDADLLLGTALFETLGCSEGVPERLGPHLERLERAARSLGRAVPPRAQLEAAARALASRLPDDRGAVRLTVVDGGRAVLGTTRPIPEPPSAGVVLWSAPPSIRARDPLESVKHSSRADKQRWRARAREAGAWDALLWNFDGAPVEATVANLWVARDGRLSTPPIHAGCLPGVVRAELLARRTLGIAGREWVSTVAPIAREDLERADELLLTNSLQGAVGVRRLLLEGAALELPGAAGAVVRTVADALCGARGREIEEPGESRKGASVDPSKVG